MKSHRARKRFGQHFLRDPGVIDAIVRAVAPRPEDVIVEIGPGRGAMTVVLAQRAGSLHAIEIDRDLVKLLENRFAASSNVVIHAADALRFDFDSLGGPLRVVGNLPYNISTPLLFHLLEYRHCIADMHFMLQKEVIDRMAASPGSKTYGRLTVMLGCRFAVEWLFDVEPHAFEPPPGVMSAVARLTPLPAGTYRITDREAFSAIVAAAFAQRRKTVRNALKQYAGETEFAAAGIDSALRPESLAIADFVALANVLAARSKVGASGQSLR